MHYFIVIAIIAIIVIIQLRSFIDTKRKINIFLDIFPKKSDKYQLKKDTVIKSINSSNYDELKRMLISIGYDSEKYHYSRLNTDGETTLYFRSEQAKKDLIKFTATTENGITVNHNNEILQTITTSINDYLQNNKSVSDFHLLKDIVDRNCDAKEEEINTQIPVPLYLGLVGTMLGILIGVGFLVFDGSLAALLGNSAGNGANGVEALLGGVAVAMFSSVLGIILTTLGSNKFKTAKSILEANEHTFLSWIQAKLLPTLSDNVVGAIREMSSNLTEFNRSFADNTSNLGTALAKVDDSYKRQTDLINAVNKIQEGRTAATNLQLLSKLIESSEQIGKLAEYLHNTNDYLSNVQALNKKLDDYENRTQFIEKASKFYSKHEKWLEENYDVANRNLAEVVGKYNIAIEETFKEIKSDIEGKRQELGTFIDSQNAALTHSTGDLDKIVKALSELGEVQKAVKAFEAATKGQNAKIDRLTEHIEKLANVKSNGGAIQIQQKTPMWQIALIGVIALSCTILAVNSFISDPETKIIQSQPIIQQPIDIIDTVKVVEEEIIIDSIL